jgi:hypothetical protein
MPRSGLVVRPHEPFVELALFLPLSQKRMSTHDKSQTAANVTANTGSWSAFVAPLGGRPAANIRLS